MNPWRALLCLTGMACAWTLCASEAQALDKVRLQLRWQHQFQFAGYYLAVDRGFYAAEGLEVELVEATGGVQPIAEVTQGRAHYGVGTSDLLLARARGHAIVALAPIYQHSPLVLVSLHERGIDSVHDLVGRRVAMEPEAAELIAYLRSENVYEKDLDLGHHAQNVSDLVSGEVDAMSAYLSDEPFAVSAAGKEVRVFSPRAAGIDFYGDTLFTSEAELRAHPERVAAFLRASLKGWREALSDPEAAIARVRARSERHSLEHLRFEARHTRALVQPEIVELGYTNPGRWQHIGEVYASLGLIEGDLSLAGFLYRPAEARPIPRWIVWALMAAIAVAIAIGAGWARSFRLARELRRVGERWRAFMEASPQPLAILGASGELHENPRMRALLERLACTDLRAIVALEDVSSRLSAARAGHAVSDVELRVQASADSPGTWLSMSAAACDVHGEHALLIALSDISARKAEEEKLRLVADTDPLTQAKSRRFSMLALEGELARAEREGKALAIALLDVDHFKKINDSFGHAIGDRVLIELVRACRAELRGSDVLGRFGGEEFLAVLTDTDAAEARLVSERLRARVASELAEVGELGLRVSVSIGVAEAAYGENAHELLQRADEALYIAKAQGRDRVCLASTARRKATHEG